MKEYHLVCFKCGEDTDLTDEQMDNLQRQITLLVNCSHCLRLNTIVRPHELLECGLLDCPQCREWVKYDS